MGYLGLAYARSGDRAAAQQVLQKMLVERAQRGYFPAGRIALVYFGLDDKDRAFQWLQRAVEERDSTVWFLKANAILDPLRSDPRFTELLQRMNLAP